MSAYPRAELETGFFLERYLGWSVLARGERYKLLTRRAGPVRRLVLLSSNAAQRDLDQLAIMYRFFGPLTTLIWNDFSAGEGTLDGRALSEITENKWFGGGTFVFDLQETEESLFGKIASRERSKIRKAERSGFEVEITDTPSQALVTDFARLYAQMAAQRSLEPLDRPLLDKMIADGVLTFARVHEGGKTLTVNVLYRTAKHAYYMHAAQDGEAKDTGGHLLLWKSLQHFKARGLSWYDFGLVPTTDPENGIYRFKKCFGGSFEPSGRQFASSSRWVDAAVHTYRRGRNAWQSVQNKAALKVSDA
jgi:hypothetical protein